MNELEVLQHALGVDAFGRGRRFRSHFVTGPGCADHAVCLALVEKGLMTRRDGATIPFGGDDLFHVTPAGDRFVTENSPSAPPAPKPTRSQRRYADFLAADCGVSFGEWLRFRCGRTGGAA